MLCYCTTTSPEVFKDYLQKQALHILWGKKNQTKTYNTFIKHIMEVIFAHGIEVTGTELLLVNKVYINILN